MVQAQLGRSAPVIPDIEQMRESAVLLAGPAVVEVQNVGKGLGSGLVLTRDGYGATNNHVLTGARHITVSLAHGKTLSARLVETDPVDDLAVVKVDAQNLPIVAWGDSSPLKVSQSVQVIGTPLGIVCTVTDGIVSATGRNIPEDQGGGSILGAIQTSAAINPGNSGALIDLSGHVIDMPTLAVIDPEFNAPATSGGFALPSNTIGRITAQLMTSGKVTHSGRAALDMSAAPVDQQLATTYNLPINHGVLIGQVQPAGAAARAGLRQGDIIVRIDQTAIAGLGDVLGALAGKRPGDQATVQVVTQQGQHKSVTVTLSELTIKSNG